MKVFLRSVFLLLLCGGFLYLMYKLEFLKVRDILNAFHERPSTLLMLACVQIFAAFAMMIRYRELLKVLGLRAPVKQVSSATFVSTAVGQWAPGSLAIVELLRVSLMFGTHAKAQSSSAASAENVGVKARLAIASFADRLVGFLGILLLGFVFSFYLMAKSGWPETLAGLLSGPGLLLLSSGVGSLSLICLPFAVRLRFFRNAERRWKRHGDAAQGRWGRVLNALLGHFETTRHNIDAGTRHPQRLIQPLLLSMLSLLLTSLSLYLSAQAIGQSLDFLQIVCAYPLISLSALLPLGFAGIGGYQIVMATIFGLFSVSPAVVASAGVLQSAVVLVVNTLLGLLYARVCSGQIRAILRRPAAASSV